MVLMFHLESWHVCQVFVFVESDDAENDVPGEPLHLYLRPGISASRVHDLLWAMSIYEYLWVSMSIYEYLWVSMSIIWTGMCCKGTKRPLFAWKFLIIAWIKQLALLNTLQPGTLPMWPMLGTQTLFAALSMGTSDTFAALPSPLNLLRISTSEVPWWRQENDKQSQEVKGLLCSRWEIEMAGIAIGAVVDAATYSTRLDAGLKSKKTRKSLRVDRLSMSVHVFEIAWQKLLAGAWTESTVLYRRNRAWGLKTHWIWKKLPQPTLLV